MKNQIVFLFLFFTPFNTYSQTIPGINNLIDNNLDLLKNKNIGFITNHSGLTKEGEKSWKALNDLNNITISKLFSPEHGFLGEFADGEKIDYVKIDSLPKLYSLYGKTRKPTSEMFSDLDLIIYDIQDVGARFYTYISTLGYCMEKAAEMNIDFIVLDRPNPLSGNLISGPILDMNYSSFIGMYPIPSVYGLTIGELAKMIVDMGWIKKNPKLTVIPMKNWSRNFFYNDTELSWVPPSPNIPDLETAIIYPATVLFEATNISEGRGTSKPFKTFGAPWIDNKKLLRELNKLNLKSVKFKKTSFTPIEIQGKAVNPKYLNSKCFGIEINITDKYNYDPVFINLNLIKTINDLFPDNLIINEKRMSQLLGLEKLNIYSKKTQLNKIDEFKNISKSFYIY